MKSLLEKLGGFNLFGAYLSTIYDLLRLMGFTPGLPIVIIFLHFKKFLSSQGGEFLAAMDEAEKRKIPVVYGDRLVNAKCTIFLT